MIAIDTHVWVWRADEADKLSDVATAAIDDADKLVVSVASCLEIATLARRGRMRFDRGVRAWINQALSSREVEVAEIDLAIATRAGELPAPFPGDPADRLIYATAASLDLPLVTADRVIREFDPERTVW